MQNRKWIGDRLWLLLNEPTIRLKQIFPDTTPNNLQNKRKMYRNKIKDGIEGNPIRPDWYSSTMSPSEIRKQVDGVESNSADLIISEQDRAYLHKVLDDTIKKANIDPSSVKGFKVTSGSHQGYIKNNEGEIEYTDPLERKGITFIAEARDFKPEWPVVTRVESIKVDSVKLAKNKNRKCVILPDLQIPYQDDEAISVALQILDYVKPDCVVFLGDSLDLPEFSKYEQRPEFARTTQDAIIKFHKILAFVRNIVPNAEIAVLAGNHEKRLEAKILNNAIASHGLRRADQLDHWPVLSVPYLTAMDSLKVDYYDGYPANKFWINQRLQARHGHLVRSSGSTAKAVSDDERVSTIFGHVHRIEMQYKTVNVYDGARTNFAFTPGCLCLPFSSKILTKKGWKDYKQVKIGDYTLGYENGKIKWTKIKNIISYPKAKTIKIKHPQFEQVCTPDHKWLIDRRYRYSSKTYYKERLDTMDNLNTEDRIILSAPYVGGNSNVTADEAALVAWIIGDGSIDTSSGGFRATIYQSPKKYTKEIEKLLSSLNYKYSKTTDNRIYAVNRYRISGTDTRKLWNKAKLNGKNPSEEELTNFLLGLNKSALDSFYFAFFMAEGTHDGENKIIAQQKGAILETLRLSIYLLGYSPREYNTQHEHIKKLRMCKPTVSNQKNRIKFLENEDMGVWCVETELGTWTAKDENRIFITGNCKIDGSVPSTKSGYDTHGNTVTNYENWQQGLAVIHYEPGDSPFHLEPIFINTFDEYTANYMGNIFKPNKKFIP